MEKFNESKKYLMNTYAQKDTVFVKGEGMYLYNEKGEKYLDFVAGIAVNCLGYGNNKLTKVLQEQVSNGMLHISNLFYNDKQLIAAEKLAKKTGYDKVFFSNSGTEANEGAIKLARKYASMKGNKEKYEIISMKNSFHGRSLGALTATGQQKYQKDLGPLLPGIKYAIYNDLESVEKLVNDKTCAIMFEVIQGEGGIIKADENFVEGIRKLCNDNDMLMIVDEVQTGIGRTGKYLASMYYDAKPDVVTLAKGIGGGLPIGAIVAKEEVAKAFNPGDHAATFGGNALCSAAVSVVMDEVLNEDMMKHVKEVGDYLEQKLIELKKDFDCIVQLKGRGLMRGIQLNVSVAEVTKKAYDKKVLLVGAGKDVIRFVPALIVEKKHIDKLINVLREVL